MPIDETPPEITSVLYYFYPEDTLLRRTLIRHSEQVRDKALSILAHSTIRLDAQLAANGALLHDIGIGCCHAPSIFCDGTAPYIAHGVIGAKLLRAYGAAHGHDFEAYARICERHTGSGLTAEEIQNQKLPIPEQNYLPETPEEQLVCLADKFFSKSGDMQEKSPDHIRRSMRKFGTDSLERFDAMCRLFRVDS